MHQSRTHKPQKPLTLQWCQFWSFKVDNINTRMKDLNLNIVMSAKSYETSGQLYKSDNIIYTTKIELMCKCYRQGSPQSVTSVSTNLFLQTLSLIVLCMLVQRYLVLCSEQAKYLIYVNTNYEKCCPLHPQWKKLSATPFLLPTRSTSAIDDGDL